jgi:hypothetical protein
MAWVYLIGFILDTGLLAVCQKIPELWPAKPLPAPLWAADYHARGPVRLWLRFGGPWQDVLK